MTSNLVNSFSEINLHKDSVFIVKGGKIELIPAPPTGYGRQIVSWNDSKPTHVEVNFTKPLK